MKFQEDLLAQAQLGSESARVRFTSLPSLPITQYGESLSERVTSLYSHLSHSHTFTSSPFVASALVHTAEKPLTSAQFDLHDPDLPPTFHPPISAIPGSSIRGLDHLQDIVKELHEMITVLQRYAQGVVDGTITEPNEKVGREVLRIIRTIPVLDEPTFKSFTTQNTKEMEVVCQLADTLKDVANAVAKLVTK